MTTHRDIIAIGGSAGALEPLRTLISALHPNLPAAVFVVLHSPPSGHSLLPDVLSRAGPMKAALAKEGEAIQMGRIYLPPPDRHLIIAENHVHVTCGPKEGLHRPAINITFRSAAATYGDRVAGVLLSGMLDDGASGLWEIAKNQGVTIVQDPEEAAFPSMPESALKDLPIDYKMKAAEIGSLLSQLALGTGTPAPRPRLPSHEEPMKFSGFTCPECRGPLWERTASGPIEFVCRVGHRFPLKTLLDEHASTRERKLYEALVCLEEGASLAEYALKEASATQQTALRREADQLRGHAAAVRSLLEDTVPEMSERP